MGDAIYLTEQAKHRLNTDKTSWIPHAPVATKHLGADIFNGGAMPRITASGEDVNPESGRELET